MEVVLSKEAVKDLKKLTPSIRDIVKEKLSDLKVNPLLGGILRGYTLTVLGKPIPLRRVRAGDYRIVYIYSIQEETVYVLAIAHRKHVYRIVRRRFG